MEVSDTGSLCCIRMISRESPWSWSFASPPVPLRLFEELNRTHNRRAKREREKKIEGQGQKDEIDRDDATHRREREEEDEVQRSSRDKDLLERSLTDVLSKKQPPSKLVANPDLTDDEEEDDKINQVNSSFGSASNDAANASSWTLKRSEGMKKTGDQEPASSASSSVVLLSQPTASSREQLAQQSAEVNNRLFWT